MAIQVSERHRCEKCGSPRLLSHPELYSLSIAHIDCDAFYASVEKRDNPQLRDKPLIIGGGKRGVVSTACYIARISGVRSAMPMYKALELCPEAVVMRPNMAKYAQIGKEIRQRMQELTPLVEPLSIDEAFLDLTGTEKLHKSSPALTLAKFAARIEKDMGLSISIGLSYCKFLAKIASDMEKPRGFSIIGRNEAYEFLAQKPVTIIWGVGKALAGRLSTDGIHKISQLQKMDETTLLKSYGVMGRRLYHLARGEDSRKVDPDADRKSISAESTFDKDLNKPEELISVLRALSEKVSARLKKDHIAGYTVVLKLKTKDFKTRTRNRHLPDPTQTTERIFRTGLDLLTNELDGTSFRLLGIGVQQLVDDKTADPADLVDQQSTRRIKAESAMDSLRDKFGNEVIETGYTFRYGELSRPQRDK